MTSRTEWSWVDPASDGCESPPAPSVDRIKVIELASGLLREALVAQRLVTAGQQGLGLRDSARPSEVNLSYWGHTFATAVAVLLPDFSDAENASEKRRRRRFQERLLDDQRRWPDLASLGDTAFLLCADDQPPEHGLPSQLYSARSADSLVDFRGFYRLFQSLLETVGATRQSAWARLRSSTQDAIVTIIAETFKNAHDHGRHEVDGSDVAHSVRGLYARFYSMAELAPLALVTQATGVDEAQRYARSFLRDPNGPTPRTALREFQGLLEVSIIDSGPGMAAKWLNADVRGTDIEAQLKALILCFEKGRTSTGKDGRGYGLAKVLLNLRELKGFMSVRTNELHMFRQFANNPGFAHEELQDGALVPKEVLFDWKLGVATRPSRRDPIKGTVVSYLFPLG